MFRRIDTGPLDVAAWSVPVRCQPRFSCRAPNDAAVAAFLVEQAAGNFSYGEAAPRRRFGFKYGTLHAHVEQGEERFSVELHADGTVWYDLRAFSRPRYWPVRLGKPIARALQRRFVRESQAQMCRAVEAARL